MNEKILEAIKQWRTKAQSDWTTVQILLGSDQCPAETVCFHCQQFVEKLLKAILTAHSVETPETHDIRRLVQLAKSYAPKLSPLTDLSDQLTVHGVETGYPGDWSQIETQEMNEVVNIAGKFGDILLFELDNLDTLES